MRYHRANQRPSKACEETIARRIYNPLQNTKNWEKKKTGKPDVSKVFHKITTSKLCIGLLQMVWLVGDCAEM